MKHLLSFQKSRLLQYQNLNRSTTWIPNQTQILFFYSTVNYPQNIFWVFIFLLKIIIVVNQFTLKLIRMLSKASQLEENGDIKIFSELNPREILCVEDFALTVAVGIWPLASSFQWLVGCCVLLLFHLWVRTLPGPWGHLWPVMVKSRWCH